MSLEVIAGSKAEEKIVDKLKEKLSESADWIDFVKTPVETWTPRECTLTIGDSEVNCIPLPYTIGGEVEDYLAFRNARSEGAGGIVLLEYPENYYSTGVKVFEAYEKGASAIILFEKNESITRKIVITNPPHLTPRRGVPLPMPVVTLDSRDYQKLVRDLDKGRGGRARLRVKAAVERSFGYTVMAGFNGRGEGEVHITSHHDHWFNGVGDSLVGLKTLESLSGLLSKTSDRLNVVLISFTAKELGSPSLKPYHWSWGSEYFLEVMNNKSRLENVVFSINIDAVHQPEPIVYYHPSLHRLVQASLPPDWEAVPGGNHYSFDSLTYLKNGIPAILVTTLHKKLSWKIHYSSLDDFENVQVNTIVESIVNFVSKTIEHDQPLKVGINGLFDYLARDDILPEYRSFVVKCRQACEVIGEFEVLRILTKAVTECGALKINENFYYYAGLIGTIFLAKLAERIIEELDKEEGRVIRLMLHQAVGDSYDLYLTGVNKPSVYGFLSGVVEDAVKRYEEAFKLNYNFKVLNASHRIQGDVNGKGESDGS